MRPTPPPLAHARGLRHHYASGRVGLADVDLAVHPGERVVLLGPNGSGKTTLLRILSTALRPDAGELALLGEPVPPATPALRRRLGVLPDRPAHLDALTARENAFLLGRAAGLAGPEARRRLDALLPRFDLAGAADVAVGSFSLGMRRKLALIEALLHEPELLVLDEPSLGLDPPGVDALVVLLEERTAAGAAVVAALNDPVVAARLATRIVMLDAGRVVADAPPADLLAELGGGARCTVEVTGPADAAVRALGDVADVTELSGGAPGSGRAALEVHLSRGTGELPAMVTALVEAGVRIHSLGVREPNLGDVFRARTGRALDSGAHATPAAEAAAAGSATAAAAATTTTATTATTTAATTATTTATTTAAHPPGAPR